jgi:aminopeptidase N
VSARRAAQTFNAAHALCPPLHTRSHTHTSSQYNLFGVYAGNAPAFHAGDGSGYAFLADTVLALDAINPQVAARIVGAFNKVGKVDAHRAGLMRAQLQRLRDSGKLSENVGEIVGRALSC